MNSKRFFSSAAIAAIATLTLAGAPAQAKGPTICKDGTTSATSGRGACSSHGGVDKAASKAAAAAPAAAPAAMPAAKESAMKKAAPMAAGTGDAAGATAKCKDGTYSHAKHHQGACSKHGGVESWMAQ